MPEDVLTWSADVTAFYYYYLSFIVLRARSLVRVVSSVHLRGRVWADRLALEPLKCFSS